jgi:hypothetical protein
MVLLATLISHKAQKYLHKLTDVQMTSETNGCCFQVHFYSWLLLQPKNSSSDLNLTKINFVYLGATTPPVAKQFPVTTLTPISWSAFAFGPNVFCCLFVAS